MKHALLLVGIVLIVAAGLWKITLTPRFNIRFPDGWSWTLSTFGTNLYADESGQFSADKNFPTDDDISVSARTITVRHENTLAGIVSLDDHYLAKDPNTGSVTWDFTYHANVDPITGQYVDDKFRGDYYFFPRNVQMGTTYRIRNTSYPGLPVTFQKETTVNGLSTYEFAYVGEYDNTAAYPDQKLMDGQSIKCTNLDLHYWVEPLTGEVVKYTEHCNADAIIDVVSNKPLTYLSRWTGETKSDSIITRVNEVSAQRATYLWLTNYLPLLLGIAGIILVGVGVIRIRLKRAPVNQVTWTA
jgi:hypothetical protein